MDRIAHVVPVTPVPLAAAALLSFGTSTVTETNLLERMDELRDAAIASGGVLSDPKATTDIWWQRASRMLRMRRLAISDGSIVVVMPRQRPLLEYYANSIAHLLPEAHRRLMTPAAEPDATLPRLARRDEVPIKTGSYSIGDTPDKTPPEGGKGSGRS